MLKYIMRHGARSIKFTVTYGRLHFNIFLKMLIVKEFA